VVNNDPLNVEVLALNVRQVSMLKLGQKLQVKYAPEDKNAPWQEAAITYFDPVANNQTDQRMFRMELPNPEGKEAGLRMIVKLPPEVAKAGADAPARMAGGK
jgi:hypothetical protein